VGGPEVGVVGCGERVALDRGEQAGGLVGDDVAGVAGRLERDLAQLVEREDVGAGDVAGGSQRRARGNVGNDGGASAELIG
jgi:hypothetical protein